MVELKVDMQRREELRRLHTATHIINFCARKVLGNHVWQNGSNLKPEAGTLDITHYEIPSDDQLDRIEWMANETIFEDKPVKIEEIERTEAEKKYGYTLYQGGAIPMKKLRIIHVLDSDIEACGGLHMSKTGPIGLIKITDVSKIQDGVIRLKYVVRNYALNYIKKQKEILTSLEGLYRVEKNKISQTAEKFFNEWKEQKKEIEQLKKNLYQIYSERLTSLEGNTYELKENFDMGFLMQLFTSILLVKDSFKLTTPSFVITTEDFRVDFEYKKEIKKKKFSIYVL